jgi:transposase
VKNKYIVRSRISEKKFREFLHFFCLDIEAKKVAEVVGVSWPSVNKIFDKIRERIAELCEAESPFENGEVELDKSYFGARRVRGIRGRGARGKIPVFGLLKRGDKVYTQVVKSCSIQELMPIIRGKTDTGVVLYSDGLWCWQAGSKALYHPLHA